MPDQVVVTDDEFIVKDTMGSFELAPEGSHQAVCCEIVDEGIKSYEYKNAKTGGVDKRDIRQLRIVFQLEVEENLRRTDGKRFQISRPFNATLAKSGSLRPFLETWRGKEFTDEELKGFNLKKLVGINAMIQVMHTKSGDRTYDNIKSIQAWQKRFGEPIKPEDYVPRTQNKPANGQPSEFQLNKAKKDEDEMPF